MKCREWGQEVEGRVLSVVEAIFRSNTMFDPTEDNTIGRLLDQDVVLGKIPTKNSLIQAIYTFS